VTLAAPFGIISFSTNATDAFGVLSLLSVTTAMQPSLWKAWGEDVDMCQWLWCLMDENVRKGLTPFPLSAFNLNDIGSNSVSVGTGSA
jgi:hypothetical protein